LREAIGPTRRIYGVDLSAGMLRKARRLSDHHHHWTNIHLTEDDAANCRAGAPRWRPLQFVIQHDAASSDRVTPDLETASSARPPGQDSKLPPGLGGKLLLPVSLWMMRSRWQLADRVATIDECRHR
jgi:hypothetical protein